MAFSGRPDFLSVLLLYNFDASWLLPEREETVSEVNALAAELRREGFTVETRAVESPDVEAALEGVDPDDGVVLNCCEGLPGVPHSEALVTQALDELGFTYTGSPTSVLEMSWEKPRVKGRLWQTGVPTPQWRTFSNPRVAGWSHFPAIVKPACEHCSFGVTPEAVVRDVAALAERVAYVLDEFRQPALVERFVTGREFHVSVWGNGRLHALPPAEMDFSAFGEPTDRLCTFDSKFTPGSRYWDGINLVLPADIDENAERDLARVAVAAYRAVGCRDYARIDMREDGNAFTVLDVNPNCDLSIETSTALAAELALGSYGALLGGIVRLAAARRPRAVGRVAAASLFGG